MKVTIVQSLGWLLFLVGAFCGAPAMVSARDLTTPPADSIDAERVRIWIPVTRSTQCRVTIDILDDSGGVIRRLADRLLSSGYYNLYWDKRNGDGESVPPGEYRYRIVNCNEEATGTVVAQYTEWEREVQFRGIDTRGLPTSPLLFDLNRDSAIVTVTVRNRIGKVVDSTIVDSVFSRGPHTFDLNPTQDLPHGSYTAEFVIGDYRKLVEFEFIPNKDKSK